MIRRLLLLLTCASLLSAPASASEPAPYIREGGEPGHRLHLALRTTFLYGTFSPALGGLVRLSGYTPVWNTGLGTGTLDVGVVVGYLQGNQVLYPWVSKSEQGADHHVRLALSLGHTFHIGRQRRSALGLHVYGGLNIQRSDWTLLYEREMLQGSASATFVKLIFDPEIDYSYRFSRRVGLNLVVGGVCPCLSGTTGPLVHVGAGLTFNLH
jgi:hypothetical protein